MRRGKGEGGGRRIISPLLSLCPSSRVTEGFLLSVVFRGKKIKDGGHTITNKQAVLAHPKTTPAMQASSFLIRPLSQRAKAKFKFLRDHHLQLRVNKLLHYEGLIESKSWASRYLVNPLDSDSIVFYISV